MHRWKNRLLGITAVLVLAGSFVAARTQDARAVQGADEVLIANGSDRPVPVALLGAVTVDGTVNVGNLPAVQQVAGDVAVSNLPAVQQVAGSVAVSNLPAVQQVTGTVQVQRPVLARGTGTIRLTSEWTQRFMTFPADVVLTDVRLERASISTSDETCEVWLGEIAGGAFGAATFFRPSATNPVVELHLESGFAAGPDTTERGFFMNADCTVRVFWTGYHL
jgi:hypothetical protein